MADLTLRISGLAKNDGKDEIVDLEHAHADGVLAFCRFDQDGSVGMKTSIMGRWSVRALAIALSGMREITGEEIFARAIEEFLRMREEGDGTLVPEGAE